LKAHAIGETGEARACADLLDEALSSETELIRVTATEIKARYVDHQEKHPYEWLIVNEMELAMAL
jgi:hypothetical protein